MKKIILGILIILFMISNVNAKTLLGGVRWNYDTDDLRIIELYGGYKEDFEEAQFAQVETGWSHYEDKDGERDFNFISLLGQKNLIFDTYGFGLIRFNDGDDFDCVTGSTYLVKEFERWRVEAFAERSMVESQLAMDDEIMWNLYGVGVDYIINETFTLVGLYSFTDSSDGNTRDTEEIGLVYSPQWAPKWYAKFRLKWSQSDFDPIEYFAPEEYEKYDVLFSYTTGFAGDQGLFVIQFAPGWQIIDGEGEIAYEYRIILNYLFTRNWEIESFIAGVNDEGTDRYRYNWGGIQLNYNF
jgi:hypothetical protein